MRVHRWAALVVLCLAVGLFLVLGPVRLHQARAAEAEEQRLLELINGYRQENDLGPLAPSGVLSASAERHSEDMSAHDFFSHSTRESSYYPSGSRLVDRAAREGYPTDVYMGENIALGQQTAEEVFEAWRNSPEHDAAMLGDQYTAVGIGHVDSYWTADFGSVADAPSYLETLEPYTGRIVEPAAGEQTSTPQSSAEQTTGERESDEQSTDDERTPEEQAQPEETPPKTRNVVATNGPAAGETAAAGQTSTSQQSASEQATDEEAPAAGDTSDPAPGGETTPGTASSSPRPPAGSTTAEQYARETGPAEVPNPSGEELAIGDPNTGMITQEATTEEGLLRASPVETEAMETALAARETLPEDLIWQASSAPEQTIGEPAAGLSPVASDLGASDSDVAGMTPVAKKKLPTPDGASPIKLFVGSFLLLCGFLVYGVAREQRGR